MYLIKQLNFPFCISFLQHVVLFIKRKLSKKRNKKRLCRKSILDIHNLFLSTVSYHTPRIMKFTWRNEYMEDTYELQINDEVDEMILAVCQQLRQLHFFCLKNVWMLPRDSNAWPLRYRCDAVYLEEFISTFVWSFDWQMCLLFFKCF